MPNVLSDAIQWVAFAWHSLVGVVTSAAIIPAIELVSLVFVLLYALMRLFTRKKPKSIEFHSSKDKIKTFSSRNGETTVRITEKTLSDNNLNKGQTILLIVGQAGNNDIQEIGVTVDTRRPHGTLFGDRDIEVSLKAMDLMGADPNVTLISAKLRPTPFGFKKLMLQSFNHPDQNVRLAWLLSFWSLLIGTIVSHFHVLFRK